THHRHRRARLLRVARRRVALRADQHHLRDHAPAGSRAARQTAAQDDAVRARARGSRSLDARLRRADAVRCMTREARRRREPQRQGPRERARAREEDELPENLKESLREFLAWLRLNQNASDHTVRAYDSDLTQFLVHTAVASGRKRVDLQPSDLTYQ